MNCRVKGQHDRCLFFIFVVIFGSLQSSLTWQLLKVNDQQGVMHSIVLLISKERKYFATVALLD